VGENGTSQVDNDTTHHTDTVEGVDMATNSDAFSITSFAGRNEGNGVLRY
jgi:hypothetical protein